MPEVRIPTTLRTLTGDRSVVRVDGSSVAEALADLDHRFPGVRGRVLDDGKVRRFVNIYVGEEDIRFLDGLDTPVSADTQVSIIPAVAGGSTSADGGILAPARASREALRVGLLGCGTVGAPVVRALLEGTDVLERAAGVRLELARVAVRDPNKARPVELPPGIITNDALAVAIDPSIDIVIEVIGGIEPALTSIKAALGDNKSVITANKELLAGPGASLLDDPDADLSYEASVCGAIPIVKTFREYCIADRIESFTGIFSGTCNFILSEMTRSSCTLDDALLAARRLGYAETDSTRDLSGIDAAAKVALLARIAFGIPVGIEDVDGRGITSINGSRIREAASEGYVYKLLGGARPVGSSVDAWVRPVLVSRHDPLAQIDGRDNAVVIETARAGRLTLQGAGAGGDPTAAAILGDVMAAARRRARGREPMPCVA